MLSHIFCVYTPVILMSTHKKCEHHGGYIFKLTTLYSSSIYGGVFSDDDNDNDKVYSQN